MKKFIEWLKQLFFSKKTQETLTNTINASSINSSNSNSIKVIENELSPVMQSHKVPDITNKTPNEITETNNKQNEIADLLSEETLRNTCKSVLDISKKHIENYKLGKISDDILKTTLLRGLCQQIDFLVNPDANETFVVQQNTVEAYQEILNALLKGKVRYNFLEVIDSELTIKK